MRKRLFITISAIIILNVAKSQHIFTNPDSSQEKLKMNTVLVDTSTQIRFMLDSTKTIITAINKNGKILWTTNPQKDNRIKFLLGSQNIVYLYFLLADDPEYKGQIVIVYQNTLTGIINKKTGKFTFLGEE
jgi:hypothetical protein